MLTSWLFFKSIIFCKLLSLYILYIHVYYKQDKLLLNCDLHLSVYKLMLFCLNHCLISLLKNNFTLHVNTSIGFKLDNYFSDNTLCTIHW